MNRIDHLSGLIAAPHTPFDACGNMALEVVTLQATHLVEQGITGVFICGTTGEGVSLTNAERRLLCERWVAAAGEDLKVIAHVGHTSLGDARELARHAESTGAWAVSSVAPYYFKPSNVDELTDYCEAIASAAPSLPFYYYHSPGMTGVNICPVDFLATAGRRINSLAGIKFNDGNLFEYQRCLAFDGGRFDIPFGVDEALIGGIAAGATSAVGSTYNYAAPLYLELIEAFRSGDMETARRCSQGSVLLVEQLIRFGAIAAGKAIMALHGIPCGNPRPPISSLSEESRTDLLQAVDRLGVLRIAAGA